LAQWCPDAKRKNRSLPNILSPAMDIVVIEGTTTYILLFGVYHPQGESSYAGLMAVNLDERLWAMIKMGDDESTEDPADRVGASMIAADNKAFIFGGGSKRDRWDVLSFSVAEFDTVKGTWKWTFIDRGLPANLFNPQLLQSLQASLVNQGQEIIFAAGTRIPDAEVSD
jgi:hypothetical protein